MTGVVSVCWHVAPASPPAPLRHCSTCRRTRPFHSSGKIRLNANGRKLDAWLIYKCARCDCTWNRTLYERVDVRALDAPTRRALQHSEAIWVQQIEQDAAALKRVCDRIAYDPAVTIRKPNLCTLPLDWQQIELRIRVSGATGTRLDRMLAQNLQLSRSALGGLVRAGVLRIGPSPKLLRKPLRSDVGLTIRRDILSHLDPAALARFLFA